jgi:DNA topoisomerase-1
MEEELKTVSLGTSKLNYLDPRITIAWWGGAGCPYQTRIESAWNKALVTDSMMDRFQTLLSNSTCAATAWCKKHDVPPPIVYTRALVDKFTWAMEVEPDFDF